MQACNTCIIAFLIKKLTSVLKFDEDVIYFVLHLHTDFRSVRPVCLWRALKKRSDLSVDLLIGCIAWLAWERLGVPPG